MEFKDRIKKLRIERELSLTELGALFDKSESACRAWELGRTKPDADTLIRLASFFDCSSDYLLGISDARFPVNTKIIESLGLTDESISFIQKLKSVSLPIPKDIDDGKSMLDILNAILPSDAFFHILKTLKSQSIREYAKKIDKEFNEGIKKTMGPDAAIEFSASNMFNSVMMEYIEQIVEMLREQSDAERGRTRNAAQKST